MEPKISNLFRTDTVMFEYDVHDMKGTVAWYQDMFGFEIIYGPTDCHTEFGLPLRGARLALSLAEDTVKIQKGSRAFLATRDIKAAEAYLKSKGAKTLPIQNVDNVVLVLWVVDPEGNYLAVEQRLI